MLIPKQKCPHCQKLVPVEFSFVEIRSDDGDFLLKIPHCKICKHHFVPSEETADLCIHGMSETKYIDKIIGEMDLSPHL